MELLAIFKVTMQRSLSRLHKSILIRTLSKYMYIGYSSRYTMGEIIVKMHKETQECFLILIPQVTVLIPLLQGCFNFLDPDLDYGIHQITLQLDRIKYYLKHRHQQVATQKGTRPLIMLEESQSGTIYINGSSPNLSIKIY